MAVVSRNMAFHESPVVVCLECCARQAQNSTLISSGGIVMFEKLTRLMGVFLVLGLLVSCADADLVGYWQFDDGAGNIATDKSGNGNNGTLIGGPTWIAGTVGGGALSFDGTDDMVEIPDAASLDLPDPRGNFRVSPGHST
jgi:hypothetical protein